MKKYHFKKNREYRKMQRIQHKQIVILLGAGFAILWNGPLSKNIRDIFIEDKKYKGPSGETLGEYIFKILKDFYYSNYANYDKIYANFETFLAVLEAILNYTINSTNTGGINESNTSFIPSIFDLKKQIETLLKGKNEDERRIYCSEIFRHYVNLLVKEIDKYNSKALEEEFKKKNSNLIKFTRFFLDRNYSVKFYTTNYDNIVPQIISPFFRMYEGLISSKDVIRRFNYDLNAFQNSRLSHFNLHGSIFLTHQWFDRGYETRYNKFSHKLPSIALPIKAGNPSERLLFSPIITGYNKTQRIVNKPFNLGFSAFSNDCNNCAALLTVGYSFSDPHINSILHSFVNWDLTNFVHVTKCTGNFENKERSQLDYSVTQIVKGEENTEWLHDVAEKKHIYKDGVDNFLNNRSNWKYLLR